MRAILIGLGAVLLSIAMAGAALAYDDPKALIEAIYTHYTDKNFDWSTWDDATIRSKELNGLYARDQAEADGEVGRIDFDPFINAQDYELSDLVVGEPATTGDTATLDVSFTNFDYAVHLTYSLVKEADGWKVDDVQSLDADSNPFKLKELLSAPMP